MSINNLIAQGPQLVDPNQYFVGQQNALARQHAQMQMANAQMEMQDKQNSRNALKQYGPQLLQGDSDAISGYMNATGDVAGAAKFMEFAQSLDKEKRARLKEVAEHAASGLVGYINMTDEQMNADWQNGGMQAFIDAGHSSDSVPPTITKSWVLKNIADATDIKTALDFVSKQDEAKRKANEPYTLSRGAQRRDAQGNIIADNPMSPTDNESWHLEKGMQEGNQTFFWSSNRGNTRSFDDAPPPSGSTTTINGNPVPQSNADFEQYMGGEPIPTSAGVPSYPPKMSREGLNVTPVPTSAASQSTLTGDGLDLAAARYRETGTMPPGFARSGQNVKILNRAAEMAAADGNTSESTVLQAQVNKANAGALLQLSKQKNLVGAFEKTAQKNLDLTQTLSDRVDRSGSPVLNRWILSGKKTIAGDADVAAFDAAMRAAISEYAKVISGASGGTVTSDSARHEIEDVINRAQTKEQIVAVINTMKLDMANRMSSFDEQENELKGNMTSGGRSNPQSTVAPTAANDDPLGFRK